MGVGSKFGGHTLTYDRDDSTVGVLVRKLVFAEHDHGGLPCDSDFAGYKRLCLADGGELGVEEVLTRIRRDTHARVAEAGVTCAGDSKDIALERGASAVKHRHHISGTDRDKGSGCAALNVVVDSLDGILHEILLGGHVDVKRVAGGGDGGIVEYFCEIAALDRPDIVGKAGGDESVAVSVNRGSGPGEVDFVACRIACEVASLAGLGGPDEGSDRDGLALFACCIDGDEGVDVCVGIDNGVIHQALCRAGGE